MKTALKTLLIGVIVLLVASNVFAGGQKEDEAAEKVTITYWHFPQFMSIPGYMDVSVEHGDWEKFLASEFMKENPDIQVNTELVPWEGGVDKINVAISGGNPPDLLFDYLGRTGNYFKQGAAVALDTLVSGKTIDNIPDAFKELYYIDGKLHGIPGMAWAITLVVNQSLTDKYGVTDAFPAPGETWDIQEFEAALTAFKKASASDNITPLCAYAGSEHGDYVWWEFIWGFDGNIIDANGKVKNECPEMVEALKYLKSLFDKGLLNNDIATLVGGDAVKRWGAQQYGVISGHGYYKTLLEKNVKEGLIEGPAKVFALPYPTKQGISPASAIGPTGYVIMAKDSEKQKAAARFIDFILSDKYYKAQAQGSGQMVATNSVVAMDVYKDDNFMSTQEALLAKYPAKNFFMSHPNYGKLRVELASMCQAIFADIKTVEQAVPDFLEIAKKLLEE